MINGLREFNEDTWGDIARKLTRRRCSTKALFARWKRRSADWDLIMDILEAYGCRVTIHIPEEDSDFNENETLLKYDRMLNLFSRLYDDDRKLASALIRRLGKRESLLNGS